MSYTIYMLPEGKMTITGAVLDGVNQGDGSHMVGATVTLDSSAWIGVDIRDSDPDFEDNDRGQRLDQDVTIDGVLYTDGTRVEAEYGITLTDGVNTYQALAFNINTTSPSYGTIEGLAFIGGIGGFPPVGLPLTVVSAQEFPSFEAATYASPVCFAEGTVLSCPGGGRAIESLEAGDLVLTRQDGAQPIRWIGQRKVAAIGPFAPVLFRPGALGNSRPLRVSRQHRIRLESWQAELMFGEPEVLVPAIHFVNGRDVVVEEGGTITYVHVLFDTHQIVLAEGVEAESFHPAAENLDLLSRTSRAELLAVFPELAEGAYGPSVHPTLKSREARALLAA